MNKRFLLGLSMLVALVFASCSDEWDLVRPQYIPFQEKEDGRWGMMASDGEVLFSGEFKRKPSLVHSGRFAVRGSNGLYSVYVADENPEVVAEGLRSVTNFYGDVAVAVKPGGYVFLMNDDGSVRVELQKLSGKKVKQVDAFFEGHAVFVTEEDLCGLIDTDGKVVIEPKYAAMSAMVKGHVLAVDRKYKQAYAGDDEVKKAVVYTLLDSKGSEVCQIKGDKYEGVALGLTGSGYVRVSVKKNDDVVTAFLDKDGEYVVEPSTKFANWATEIDEKIFFTNEDGECGVADLDGDIIIRPKYSQFQLLMKDRYFVKTTDDDTGYLIDEDGERIKGSAYEAALSLDFHDRYSFVRREEGDWRVIDSDAEKLEMDVKIYDIDMNVLPGSIYADYVDVKDFVSRLDVSERGAFGATMDMTLQQAYEWYTAAEAAPFVSSYFDNSYDSYYFDGDSDDDSTDSIAAVEAWETSERAGRESVPTVNDLPGEVNDSLGALLYEAATGMARTLRVDKGGYSLNVEYAHAVADWFYAYDDNFNSYRYYKVYPQLPARLQLTVPLNQAAKDKAGEILTELQKKFPTSRVLESSSERFVMELPGGRMTITAFVIKKDLVIRWDMVPTAE